ncbi:MAG: TRAP transporter large permease subunit [Deltaproteobacteria bacterium]|nr:TRAP transporter large permease subunit [Deltaproteobacteria bacterium]
MFDLEPGAVTAIMFGGMMLLMVVGMPLSFALGFMAMFSGVLMWGTSAIDMIFLSSVWMFSQITMVALPLFIFMGVMMERSGIMDELFTMIYKLMGALRGGLAIGIVGICVLVAAMSGVSGAATVAMGIIAVPALLKRGYDKRMITGAIQAGGALGFLIPPSVLMIFYALITGTSVGKLFAGGIGAGLLLACLFALYILIRCAVQPQVGPAIPPEERVSGVEKLKSLKALILPGIIIFLVLGSMFLGLASPTEAAALGAAASILCAVVRGTFKKNVFNEALMSTTKTMGMVAWVIICATCFAKVYTALGAVKLAQSLIGDWTPLLTVCVTLASLFVLGMFLDEGAIIFITAPLYVPLVTSQGYDPVWYGVQYMVVGQTAFLTPPFGYNLFYMRAVVPPEITMGDIYKSVIPFVALQLLGTAIMIAFPQVILWIPNHLFG